MVCSRLEAADIGYMLTGSLAMNYYAQPRMTRDIDLVVALGDSDSQRLPELFAPDFYVDAESVSRAVHDTSMFTHLLHKFAARDRCTARYSSVSGARAQFSNPHIE